MEQIQYAKKQLVDEQFVYVLQDLLEIHLLIVNASVVQQLLIVSVIKFVEMEIVLIQVL